MSFFQDDNRARNFLNANAVNFEYDEAISYDELKEGWRQNNRGRPESQQKNEQAVISYAERGADGSRMPAVIVRKTQKGLDVLDGCHRLMAGELLNAATFAAFVVSCRDDTARKLRIWSNTGINGEAVVDPDWSVKTMIEEFVVNGSDTIESLAQFMGRPASDIQKRYEAMKSVSLCTALLEAHGRGESPHRLKQGVASAFVSRFEPYLEKAPEQCAKILRMPAKYGLTNGDTEELFDALLPQKVKKNSEKASLNSKIREVEQSEIWQGRLKVKKTVAPGMKVSKAVAALLTCAKDMDKKKASWHLEDLELLAEMHEVCLLAGRTIRKVCDAELKNALDKRVGGTAYIWKC